METSRRYGAGTIFEEPERAGWAADLSLGKGPDGKRRRRRIRGKTPQEVERKLAEAKALSDYRLLSNEILLHGDQATMVCRDQFGQAVQITLDAADVQKIEANGHVWSARWRDDLGRHQIAGRTPGTEHVPLGRFLLDAPPGLEINHSNGDLLDYRKSNLRLLTHAQNRLTQRRSKRNTTGVVGTSRLPNGKFAASAGGVYAGTFDTLEEAAEAVRQKREELIALLGSS